MTRMVFGLCAAAVLVLPATGAQAQTACPGAVAQLTSPAPGSTLPSGGVTFTWCNASADYFLTIESPRGAANIFNAFVVGVESVTIGPACNVPSATNPTTECIPANGEAIFVTLWTNTAQTGRKNFVAAPTVLFTAPNQNPASAPEATTTAVAGPVGLVASSAGQSVTLSATVAAVTAVNQGNVTFRLVNGAAAIGSAATSATIAAGSASVTYLVPGGTPAGSYTIEAAYSGGPGFGASSGAGTLVISPAPAVAASTNTTVAAQSAPFSASAQAVTLSAIVAAASAVNEGVVTFNVLDASSAPVAAAATSGTVANGAASVAFVLPAGLPAGDYTIQADYSDGTAGNFLASSTSGTLTVTAPAPPTQSPTATAVDNNAIAFDAGSRSVTLSATVSVAGGTVTEGSVVFQVLDAASHAIGAAVASPVITAGAASVAYTLPAALPAGAYTIDAAYSGGSSFLPSVGSGVLTIADAPASLPPTIDDLVAKVNALRLEAEDREELLAKLQSALDEMARGRLRAVVRRLRSFVEEVHEAQAGGTLDATDASALASETSAIIARLGGK